MIIMDLIRTRAAIKASQIKAGYPDKWRGIHADYPSGIGSRAWIRDALFFVLCRYCFKAVIWTPVRFSNNRVYFWLLGKAGIYAYSEGWRDFRGWCQWMADGKPEMDWRMT